MAARRDTIYFEHARGSECRDARFHRSCTGRWRGEISLGFDGSGKRLRRKVSGRTKTEVGDELDRVRDELAEGIRTSGSYTPQQGVEAWLADGMSGRSAKTIAKYRHVLKPVLARIGGRKLRELTAADIRGALRVFAATHATDTVGMARLSLERAIRHVEGAGLVRRHVAELVDAPQGQPGRPSRALSPEQAEALLKAAEESGLRPYIVLSVMTGMRTEELRALR